jgi:hypothetical protein
MPIATWQTHGDFSPAAKKKYGFSHKDAALLTQHTDKIHKKWSNSQNNFDFYFVRSPLAYKQVEVGEVTPQWVKEKIGIDVQPNPQSITVIFTNNVGTEKIPMTAWALAHRLGHAIRRNSTWKEFERQVIDDANRILRNVYGIERSYGYHSLPDRDASAKLRDLFHAIGTMKSARDQNLVTHYEFLYEMLAQYILTGKIKFNPLPTRLGRPLVFGKGGFRYSKLSEEERQEYSDWMQSNTDNYVYYLDAVLDGLVGKIFVM